MNPTTRIIMKLRKETIEQIKTEVKDLNIFITTHMEASIEEMFELLVEHYQLRGDALDTALDDPSYIYFDIHTDHTITTVQLINGKWSTGSIDVWEDEESCGIWDFKQIINNEVEYNKSEDE